MPSRGWATAFISWLLDLRRVAREVFSLQAIASAQTVAGRLTDVKRPGLCCGFDGKPMRHYRWHQSAVQEIKDAGDSTR